MKRNSVELEIGVWGSPSPRNQSLSIAERDTIIRARYAAGESQADLALEFGISYQRVYQIVRGKRK